MKNIAIIDYGSGNISSLFVAFRSIGAEAYLASSFQDLKKAKAIVLPGVGHFGYASENLDKRSIKDPLIKLINNGIPTLGICLGFQLLTKTSEESHNSLGLGILPLKTIRLKPKNSLKFKVPHVGWNNIEDTKSNSILLKNISSERKVFYYSNSYGISPSNEISAIQETFFHEEHFIAILEYKNLFGVQFHPEKSRIQGLQLLKNFLKK